MCNWRRPENRIMGLTMPKKKPLIAMNPKRFSSMSSTAENYDRLSRVYDLLAGIAEKKYKLVGLRALQVTTGERVLEIGFGTGQCILPLAKAVGDRGFVHGIDLSEGMLQVAEQKIKNAGLQAQVKLRCGDARELPYPADHFYAVYLSFTLELFADPDIPIVLQEIRRVMKPVGRLCVVAMAKRKNTNLMTRLYVWLHQHFPTSIDCRPIEVVHRITENGFSVQQVIRMSLYGLPVDVVVAQR